MRFILRLTITNFIFKNRSCKFFSDLSTNYFIKNIIIYYKEVRIDILILHIKFKVLFSFSYNSKVLYYLKLLQYSFPYLLST